MTEESFRHKDQFTAIRPQAKQKGKKDFRKKSLDRRRGFLYPLTADKLASRFNRNRLLDTFIE
ncbi:MAG: hypothetical protein NVSMB9_15560 [Isosphaeraceae bacterium]